MEPSLFMHQQEASRTMCADSPIISGPAWHHLWPGVRVLVPQSGTMSPASGPLHRSLSCVEEAGVMRSNGLVEPSGLELRVPNLRPRMPPAAALPWALLVLAIAAGGYASF